MTDWNEMQDLVDQATEFDNVTDFKRYDAPKSAGLYLVSNTLFNPFTNEQYYLIKVGESTNLYQRMKSYRTTNPMVFHIDFLEWNDKEFSVYGLERECHALMLRLGFIKAKDASEWFLVSRERYLEICKKGFAFFLENCLTDYR
jgi:hypothetical protein